MYSCCRPFGRNAERGHGLKIRCRWRNIAKSVCSIDPCLENHFLRYNNVSSIAPVCRARRLSHADTPPFHHTLLELPFFQEVDFSQLLFLVIQQCFQQQLLSLRHSLYLRLSHFLFTSALQLHRLFSSISRDLRIHRFSPLLLRGLGFRSCIDSCINSID